MAWPLHSTPSHSQVASHGVRGIVKASEGVVAAMDESLHIVPKRQQPVGPRPDPTSFASPDETADPDVDDAVKVKKKRGRGGVKVLAPVGSRHRAGTAEGREGVEAVEEAGKGRGTDTEGAAGDNGHAGAEEDAAGRGGSGSDGEE